MTTTTKRTTPHAQAAKEIRKALKTAYPHTTFKVRSKSYTGGSSIDIDWVDGPTVPQVNDIVGKYEQGHFDGMTDMYEYSNSRDDIPQVKFVHCSREHSRETFLAIVEYINTRFGWSLVPDPQYNRVDHSSDAPRGNMSGWKSQEIWPTFAARSLVCPECKAPAMWDDAYCAECGTLLAPKDQD